MGFFRGWTDYLRILPWLALLSFTACQDPHFVQPNLDLGNLPNTSFSCEGKVVGGYYADFETGCQMFHVCTLGSKGETQDIKFMCLAGTVFDQKTRVCERSEEVPCIDVEHYDVNKELYHNSNKISVEFDGNVTDSAGGESVLHPYVPSGEEYEEASARYPPSDYRDDFSSEWSSGRSSTRTRSEVPVYRRRTGRRRGGRRVVPQQPAFIRFQTTTTSTTTTTTPSTTTRHPAAHETATVPIIPAASDPDRPRVIVTNGMPFVPKLDSPDPAPALTTEEEYSSLALPETNFSCEGKVSGGHYADPETNCKMFHICVIGADDTITDYKFLCGNNTAFEQKSRTCQEIDKIDCASSSVNYYVNNHLIIPTTKAPGLAEPATDRQEPAKTYDDYYDYYVDYADYKDYFDSPDTGTSPEFTSRRLAPE
ncbi:uncharacterized protein LOC122378144 isoform X1 [Amphibalanus amphitrite]|uniref:uncharacterized protein LOC122378144 isoform X1 n=1 Tax=Amphibalanus amphitrite TaxID=1232801 RepID=UPI001C908DA8|nr:uncharacterized protein LOC122378144 isoform X1 [Amphibalanus amphitrite]